MARPAPAQSESARAMPMPPPLPSVASPRPAPVTTGIQPNMGLSDVLMLASLGVSGGSAPGATGSAQRMDPTGFAAKAHHGFPGACSVGLCVYLITPMPGHGAGQLAGCALSGFMLLSSPARARPNGPDRLLANEAQRGFLGARSLFEIQPCFSAQQRMGFRMSRSWRLGLASWIHSILSFHRLSALPIALTLHAPSHAKGRRLQARETQRPVLPSPKSQRF